MPSVINSLRFDKEKERRERGRESSVKNISSYSLNANATVVTSCGIIPYHAEYIARVESSVSRGREIEYFKPILARKRRLGGAPRPGRLSRFQKMRRKLHPPLYPLPHPPAGATLLPPFKHISLSRAHARYLQFFSTNLYGARDLLPQSASSTHTHTHKHTYIYMRQRNHTHIHDHPRQVDIQLQHYPEDFSLG